MRAAQANLILLLGVLSLSSCSTRDGLKRGSLVDQEGWGRSAGEEDTLKTQNSTWLNPTDFQRMVLEQNTILQRNLTAGETINGLLTNLLNTADLVLKLRTQETLQVSRVKGKAASPSAVFPVSRLPEYLAKWKLRSKSSLALVVVTPLLEISSARPSLPELLQYMDQELWAHGVTRRVYDLQGDTYDYILDSRLGSKAMGPAPSGSP